MSAFTLRLTAVLLMLADHIGILFALPKTLTLLLRCVGRVAFPLFAFLIVNGLHHTKSRGAYLLRLLLFAAVSEPFFDSALHGALWYPQKQNVFFTLVLGLSLLLIFDFCKKRTPLWGILGCLSVAVLILAADLLRTDYGALGVALILLYHLAWGKKPLLAGITALFSARFLLLHYGRFVAARLPVLQKLIEGTVSLRPSDFAWITLSAAVAMLPILLYNGKKGWTPRNPTAALLVQYGFYLFYPLHLLILAIFAVS